MLNTPETGGFIFDTTCLNYFALTGHLSILEKRYANHAFVSRHVIRELEAGLPEHPQLQEVLAARWLRVLRLEEPDDLAEFTNLLMRLGKAERNLGEAATIVLAKRFGLVAVIDESVGRKLARTAGLEVIGIVGILAKMTRDHELPESVAWKIHQQMVSINPNGFRSPISSRMDFRRLCRGS